MHDDLSINEQPELEADAYMDEGDSEELDLSFLDEEEQGAKDEPANTDKD